MKKEKKKEVINLLSSEAKYSHIEKYQAELHEKEYYITIEKI